MSKKKKAEWADATIESRIVDNVIVARMLFGDEVFEFDPIRFTDSKAILEDVERRARNADNEHDWIVSSQSGVLKLKRLGYPRDRILKMFIDYAELLSASLHAYMVECEVREINEQSHI